MSITRSLLAVFFVCALVLSPIAAHSDCPGVTHTNYVAGGWEYDELYDSASSQSLTVTFSISDIGSKTTVQVYDGDEWITVTGSATIEGTKTRLSADGSASIYYVFEDCGDELQNSND